MAFTGRLGTSDSQLGNIVPGSSGTPAAPPLELAHVRTFGIGGYPSMRTFDVGTLFSKSDRTFDIQSPPAQLSNVRSFDIVGGLQVANGRPFDILGAIEVRNSRPFAIAGSDLSPARGAYVNGVWRAGLLIFDITGQYLGNVTDFTLTASPMTLIGDTGTMRFYMPRTLFDEGLVVEDRLVLVANDLGFKWAGTISVQDSGESRVTVSATDLMTLWSVVDQEMTVELADNTRATGVYSALLAKMNLHWGNVGEMLWKADFLATELYPGDIDEHASGLAILRSVADRSQTEWAYRVEISGSKLVPYLVVRDRFESTGGAALVDGPGGNVAAGPRHLSDSSDVVHAIELTGQSTDIGRYLPEWARWAVHEITPTAKASVPVPAGKRHVSMHEARVDWSLSKSQQKALAQHTLNTLMNMYRSFLWAWHDQEGRPYHQGYGYSGAPDLIDEYLHTGLGWRTRQALVEINKVPAASVMRSESEQQILVVEYNRLTGVQNVRRRWFSEVEGTLYTTMMEIHGFARRFERDEGGVLKDLEKRSFDHTGALVSSYTVTMPYDDDKGVRTWYPVRRVTNLSEDGTIREGYWFIVEPPTGPTTGPMFTKPTIGDAPYMRFVLIPLEDYPGATSAGVVTAAIENVYGFELDRIRDWDPRRDGIGMLLNRRSIVANQVSTARRWFRVPWGVGGNGRTRILLGITALATMIHVESVFGFPTTTPFQVTLGLDPADETVTVTKINGTEWTISRTEPREHEINTEVTLVDPKPWEGFEFPWSWPEGERYVRKLLAKASKPFRRVSLEITNRNGVWQTIKLGSLHTVTLSTEGPLPGITENVRVIGYAIDEDAGRMELLLEVAT